jgi:cyclohexanone monooxygenase
MSEAIELNPDGRSKTPQEDLDVVIVGAGFAGVYALYRMRALGRRARVLDAAEGVGGTWFWNRYPGARCDVESMQYSYSFSEEIQREWSWSELYAAQPEIARYINFVVDRLDLRKDIQLNARVVSATFDEVACEWAVRTEAGETFVAPICIMATGCLSVPVAPDLKGLDTFKGRMVRTSDWPHEGVDLKGKRVGIIGTGSSGIQAIPVIAKEARHLFVFQRTPNYSIPARNRPMDPEYERGWKENYPRRRMLALETRNNTLNNAGKKSGLEVSRGEFEKELESRWKKGGIAFMYAYTDIASNRAVNEATSDFVRRKIAEIVKDPVTAEKLTPHDYPIGTKRICVDTEYFETFNRDNVTLVDVKKRPIKDIAHSGVLIGDKEYPVDVLVLAIGFDAMTGALMGIDITGRNGRKLRDDWKGGPKTYLGLMVSRYPNLFTITGPQSPSVFTNMVTSIEQHVDWIAACLTRMKERGERMVEAEEVAQDEWVAHANQLADNTLLDLANSWYVGANIAGKARVVMPYVGGAAKYLEIIQGVARNGYRGFRMSA